jgi:S1-C subfamily serine protease
METPKESRLVRFPTALIALIAIAALLIGGLVGYAASYSMFQGRINNLQTQLSSLPTQNVTYLLDTNVSLSQLYAQVRESVVVIVGMQETQGFFGQPVYSQVQGSGFVYNSTGRMVVVTNYHVVQNTVNVTVTFADGKAYEASVLGYDAYEDLAVVSVDAPESELKPLSIMSSSTIEVGDPVIAVGSPYGLEGSLTTGIVSALGRTLSESMAGGYPIANVIQTSTAINPGNSGGPLLTYEGRVVGITTAIVSDSQGLGFAVPSSAILREIGSLITTGTYDQHAALGVSGTDMSYDIAKAMNVNVTYGWLIAAAPSGSTLHGGTTQVIIDGSQVTIGGDIVIALNGTGIRNIDDLSSYLDANTLPGQTVNVTVVRSGQTTTLSVVLGKRSSPSSI